MIACAPTADAVEHLRAGADPGAVADRHACRGSRLLQHRRSTDPRSRGRRRSGTRRRPSARSGRSTTRLAENSSQLKPMLAPSAISMSPFLHDRIVLRPMKTPLPIRMPRLVVALRVEQAVVVDDDVVADVDLVRMAQDDVLAEDDVAPARAEQRRIERLAQHEAQRAGTGLRERDDELVLQQRAEPGSPDDEGRVLRHGSTCRARTAVPAPSPIRCGSMVTSEPSLLPVPVEGASDALSQSDLRRVPDFPARAGDVERPALREEVDPPPVERRLDPKRRAHGLAERRLPSRTARPAGAEPVWARAQRRR